MLSFAWAIIGVAFAAFSVWLSVRIANRHERWAKRTALGAVVVVLGYLASFGPFIGLYHRRLLPDWAVTAGMYFYWPQTCAGMGVGPEPLRTALNWYANLWVP
jgi:uncharacterized membrane protein YhaH (DUF805 family)